MWSLIKTGDMYGADFCYHKLPEELDIFDNDAFEKSPMEFYVVCTDVLSGKPVYKKCDSLRGDNLQWIRASASLPLVSRIVEVDGKKMLDGGMSDAIPLKYFEDLGYEKNIVIMTRPEGYKKSKSKMSKVLDMLFRNYPGIVKAMGNRYEMYNSAVSFAEKREKEGKALVLRPKEALPVKRTSKDAALLQKTYDIGRAMAIEKLSEIKAFLDD